MGIVGFDNAGWLVAFICCAIAIPVSVLLYVRERRGRGRLDYLTRYRWGVGNAIFITLLVGLRSFVFHQ